jgi:flagellar basal body-associated protein FliL
MQAALNSALGRTTLGSDPLKIGRAPDNQLTLNDAQASTHHAEITRGADDASYFLTDLNSTNGTFVNEQRIAPNMPRRLNAGDVIRIGGMRFTYEISGASGYAATVRATPDDFANAAPPAQPAQPFAQYGAPPQMPQQPAYGAPAYPPPQQPFPAYGGYGAPPQQPAYGAPAYPPPQPGYAPAGVPPLPGQYGVPPMPQQPMQPKKKGKAGLWITLIIVFVLVVGCGGFGVFYLTRSTPSKTLQAFCTALMNDDAQGIHDQYSQRAQTIATLDNINKELALIQQAGGVKSCTYSNVQENGSTATADITLTLNSSLAPTPKPAPTNLINENGTWKIDAPPTQNQS